MCGIAGMVGREASTTLCDHILQSMARRGPDGNGIYVHNGCTLLHARLAIIDPAGGAQPMQLDWRGEQYCLVYNGELYNTPELRMELMRQGHSFMGHSDTEVVLHLTHRIVHCGAENVDLEEDLAVGEYRSSNVFIYL